MQKQEITNIDYILFLLLKAALWNQMPKDIKVFETLSQKEWELIMLNSANNAVKAIAYDGVCAIQKNYPTSINIEKKIKLAWAYNVDIIEQQYAYHKKTAEEFAHLMAKHNIKTTIIKGLSLSNYYPIAKHRECGDIDIFLNDNYNKGNQIIKDLSIAVNTHYEKHSSFYYKKIDIENHKFFLNKQVYKVDKILEEHLNTYLHTEPQTLIFNQEPKIYTPSANFNTIFLSRHMISHLSMGSKLRHYTDWCLYINANKDKIDFDKISQIFIEAKLGPILNAINYFCINNLGLETNYFPKLGQENTIVSAKLLSFFEHNKISMLKHGKLANLIYKAKLVIYQNIKESKLVHGQNKIALLSFIILRQIKRYKEIFKV